MVVTFSLLDLGCLSLLIGLKQPLEVVLFELSNIRMRLLLSDLDTLVPSVELLVHSHCLFNLIVLDQDSLSLVELLVKNCKFGLNSEVVDTLLGHDLVDLSEVAGFRDITKGSIAPLSNEEVLLLKSHLCNCLPVCLGLWCQLKWVQNLNSSIKSIVLKSSSESD